MPTTPSIGFLGSVGASPAEIVDLARQAELAGWKGVWMIEYEYDSIAFCQAIAAGTSCVSTGSCISRAYARHPLLAAETAAVVDGLAPGRFVIGLGNGGVTEPASRGGTSAEAAPEADALALQRWGMPSRRPVARMREYIEVIRLALAGGAVDYAGEFYQFEGVKLSLTASGQIPIYLGARREGMLRLAGEAADGVFLFLVGRQTAASTVEVVHRAALESGRRPDSVAIGCLIPTCVSDDGESAREAMRRHLVDFYLGRAAYADVLAGSGLPEIGERLREHVCRGESALAASRITDEALDELAIAGTPGHCRSLLADWVERGIEIPVLYVFPPHGDWGKAYRAAVSSLSPG